MVTANDCYKKYGDPVINEAKFMVMWDVPADIEIGVIPNKLYCNKDMIAPLTKAFTALVKTGKYQELKTWDGCFNIRLQRGSKTKMSLHSFGIAVDINASDNRQGSIPKLSPELVKCFTDNGFDWGGNWKGKSVDGMHFELSNI
jgi:hypothetical protein